MFTTVDCPDSKVDSDCVRVSELFRAEFLDATINNCQTGKETKSTMTPWDFISTGISGSDDFTRLIS
jgi:hypothetical protein